MLDNYPCFPVELGGVGIPVDAANWEKIGSNYFFLIEYPIIITKRATVLHCW
jgi:hypothetical protein